jgi:hypothetical protein
VLQAVSKQEEWVDESLVMAVWGSRSFGMTLTAPCAVLRIQWTSPTWQWYSTRFDTHLNGASLLGTNNQFLAIRDVHLNTKQHISSVQYTSLQPLFWLRTGWQGVKSSSLGRVKNFLSSNSSRPASGLHRTYPMSTRGSFPCVKTAGKWSWPLTSS